MSFVGAGVKEAFVTMLDLAVVLQLVPYLYMHGGVAEARQTIGARRGVLQQDHSFSGGQLRTNHHDLGDKRGLHSLASNRVDTII